MISMNDGSKSAAPSKRGSERFTLRGLHLQHFCLSLTSQAGLLHCSSHLGRGQVVGLAQLQEQEVSSHRGAQLAIGATQVVWH